MKPGDSVTVKIDDHSGEEVRGTVIAVNFPPPPRDPATGFSGLRSAIIAIEVVVPE